MTRGLYSLTGGLYRTIASELSECNSLDGPVDAERRGIVLVHQEIMLAPHLSIAQNMFLGREVRRGLTLDDKTMNRRATEAMRAFGVEVPPGTPVGRLSIAQRQLAQIARALLAPHRVVIFDEPTASLTPIETDATSSIVNVAVSSKVCGATR